MINNTRFRLRLISGMYFFGFAGFDVLLLLVIRAGFMSQSTLFTVPYRAVFLLFSLGVIFWGVRIRAIRVPAGLLFTVGIFWSLWFLRLFLDVMVLHRTLGMSGWEYLQRAVGMTVLPMLAFGLRLDAPMAKRGFNAIIAAAALFCLFALLTYGGMTGAVGYRMIGYEGYALNGLISPLSLSIQGTILTGLSVWYMVNRRLTLGHMILIILGLYMLFMGESRGPLLALVVAFAFLALASIESRQALRRLGLLFIGVGTLVALLLATRGGLQTRSRLDLLVEGIRYGDADAGSGRVEIYRDAFQQFLNSPWLGSSVEESNIHFYPHNSLLEAFMATGILGGMAFVVIFAVGWRQAWQLLKYGGDRGWLAVLFILFAVEGLFSGSVIDPGFWFVWFTVIGNRSSGVVAAPKNQRIEKSYSHEKKCFQANCAVQNQTVRKV